VIGVILSGHRDDGTAGLLAVKRHGGVAVVQDPDEACAPGMPRSALAYVAVDYTLPLASMGPLLGRLATAVAEAAEHRLDDAPEMASADHGVLDVTDGGDPGAVLLRRVRRRAIRDSRRRAVVLPMPSGSPVLA
jgi:hypothetical protein